MDIAKASAKIFVVRIINSLSSFLAIVLFSRFLGASPLGSYYPYVALLGMLALPTDLGISMAIEKRISEGSDRSHFFGAGLIIKLPLVAIASVAILLFQNTVNNYLGGEVAVLLVVGLWLRVTSRYMIGILKGELRVGETAVVRLLRPLCWLIFGYIFLLLDFGVEGIIYGYLIGQAAMLALATWKVSIRPVMPDRSHMQSLFDFGKYSFVSSIGGLIYSWMDVLILSAFVAWGTAATRADIGAYENAWRVSLLVSLLSRSISQVVFPQVSHWDANDQIEKIENLLAKALVPGLIVVFPAFAGVLLLSEEILSYLFGSEFAVAAPAFIVLVSLRFFQSIDDIYGRILDALDRPDLTMISTIVSIITNLTLNVVLIYYLGIVGAAIGTTVAFAIKTVLDVYFMRDFVNIQFPYRTLAWSGLSSIVMAGVLYAILFGFEITSMVGLIGIVAIGGVVYSAVLVLNGRVRKQLWEFVGPSIESRIP